MMKKVEVIVNPLKMDDLKEALISFGVNGMTIYNVNGCGMQKGHTEVYRGEIFRVNLLHKIKFELVIKDELLEDILALIEKTVRTGKVGDGKIFVTNIETAIRIRTGERGNVVL